MSTVDCFYETIMHEFNGSNDQNVPAPYDRYIAHGFSGSTAIMSVTWPAARWRMAHSAGERTPSNDQHVPTPKETDRH